MSAPAAKKAKTNSSAAAGKSVAIVGSGLIGRCWAMMFARAGFTVRIFDINAQQIADALVSVKSQLEGLAKVDLLDGQTVDEVAARVLGEPDLAKAVQGAVYLQECCPEMLELKKKVFKNIDAVCDDKIIIASSSSCIIPSLFTEDLKHRSQCIVAHPINPPHYIPLVEIVPAPWTQQAVTDNTRALMEQLGQAPVVLKKEVNGFILNRLQYAVLMEGWRIVEEGVCTPEDVDTAVKQGLGLRWAFMGPFETIDLNAPNGVNDYCTRYGENITAICAEQDKQGARAMKDSPTAEVIHDAMRKSVPADGLGERRKWRDDRLANLYLHKRMMSKKEAEAAGSK